MESKTKGIHHAWLILIVCMGIMGGLVGILLNCTGVIFASVLQEFGFRTGDLSIYYTIRTLARARALGFAANLFFKRNSKAVLIGLTLLTCGAYMSMAFYTRLWQWYISAVIVGIGTSYTGVSISVMLANWFATKKGFVMGLAMSASGISGALVSPLASKLIETMGWRGACVVLGILTAVVVCLPAWLFLVLTPEEMGLKPYGYGMQTDETKSEPRRQHYNVPGNMLIVCTALIAFACFIGRVVSQLPLYSQKLGYGLSVGAMLTSFSMMGNVLGKLMTGFLADRIGVFKSFYITMAMVVLALLMFIFCTSSPNLLYLSSLLFGVIFAVDANMAPLIFMDVWGADYQGPLKTFNSVYFAIGAISSSGLPYIYDFTQSFNVIFVLGIALVTLSVFIASRLERWVKNRRAATVSR